MFLDKRIKECQKIIKKKKEEVERLEMISYEDCTNKANREKYLQKLDELVDYQNNEYAKTIFEVFSVKKPKLRKVSDGSVHAWDDVFCSDFSKLSEDQKGMLVCLFEDNCGTYKLK